MRVSRDAHALSNKRKYINRIRGAVVTVEREGVVERAFQIARGAEVRNMCELHEQLAAEGYPNSNQSLAGRQLSKKLATMIETARQSIERNQADAPRPEENAQN